MNVEKPSSPNTVTRGQSFYGVDIGVILMDSDAPRAVGDIGNARTFDFPVAYTTAAGADAISVVENASEGLLPQFVHSGKTLVSQGVRAISTSCGFTAIHQREMADRLNGVVATSALLQIPLILRMLASDAQLGVITANATTLTDRHLEAVGVSAHDRRRLHLIGLENTDHLYNVLVRGTGDLDLDLAADEVLDAATTAVTAHPNIRAFVLECTNLPPYAQALRDRTGLPVWDITSMIKWIQHGIRP
ncbi:hypothetical protein HNP84_005285 [Thermocatellispora tengchongensis]|uniref:Aspartate/glutamate racemase family protein n=1 Tax=Thermocatellispora tengchongensis TaxID=1073253 RepID=A0A840PCH4_9ACTN|nr:aspartate/glutamate racemase family protein [Thermocatellispora tengchongensis]MBB5135541.1 hypothetical protein [Thermocatellispora tengchongensis]